MAQQCMTGREAASTWFMDSHTPAVEAGVEVAIGVEAEIGVSLRLRLRLRLRVRVVLKSGQWQQQLHLGRGYL